MPEINNSETQQDAPIQPNWLMDYMALLVWLLIAVSTYGISAAANESMNPAHWSGFTAFVATALEMVSLWGYISFLDSQDILDLERIARGTFDFDEYVKANKSGLDAILSHYGYVATAGLFFAVSIFSLKPFIKTHPTLGSGLLALAAMFTILLYVLFLFRLARRFTTLKKKYLYVIIVMTVAFIDTQAILMIIKGVPESAMPAEKQISIPASNT